MRSRFLKSLIVATCLGSPSALVAGGEDVISEFISKARPMVDACSRAASAIDLSVNQLGDLAFPDTGKFVLVNIAAGSLVAYENGMPIMEMDAIVGKPEHETPEFDTEITSVRLNPTWTVPWSIIREEDWLERLETDPDFFRRNRFEIRDGEGDLMSLDEAAADPHRVRKFIQAPGRYNALGKFRFNIGSSQAIYLHDTRNRENFYDGSPITLSHGCVRIEKPLAFAAWLLERSETEITAMTRDGWTRDISLGTDVPIIMDYFTAWPNSAGELMIYDDIYDKEQPACRRPEEKS